MEREYFKKHYTRLEELVLNTMIHGEEFSLKNEDADGLKAVAKVIAKAALDGDFEILYKPQVNFDGSVKSAESSTAQVFEGIEVDGRVLSFIAKTNKFEKTLNSLVLQKICSEMPEILKVLGSDYSVIHGMNPELFTDEFCQEYCELLIGQKLRPENLSLGFSENSNFKKLSPELMLKLKSLGTKFVLTEVGLGKDDAQPALNFPFDELQIAKEIVQGIDKSDINQQFVEDLVQSHVRDMKILADGVQTKEEHDTLQDLSYTTIDGYVYSNAFAKDEFIEKSSAKKGASLE